MNQIDMVKTRHVRRSGVRRRRPPAPHLAMTGMESAAATCRMASSWTGWRGRSWRVRPCTVRAATPHDSTSRQKASVCSPVASRRILPVGAGGGGQGRAAAGADRSDADGGWGQTVGYYAINQSERQVCQLVTSMVSGMM